MKKFFLAILALVVVSGAYAQENPFPDVPEGSYAAEAVELLADLGIVIGFPDGTFRGNEAFTRYQAALVVSRLLATIDTEFLSQEDLDTVVNALQEIASDVTANAEDIAALEDAIANAPAGTDPAALEDLQNQLDALRVEFDTLNAAGQAAAALEQQVNENTRNIGQLNDLVQILSEDITGLGTGGDIDLSFLDTIDQNTGDIANLREFVVLLRRDQVDVRERVVTLERQNRRQARRLGDLESRVAALEGSQVAFSGSIGLEYSVGRLSGAEIPFDVDRIFGSGLEREGNLSIFTDTFDDSTADLNDDGDADDAGEEARDRQDIEFSDGEFDPVLNLDVDFSAERGLAPESGLNTFESSVSLELVEATVLEGDVDVGEEGAVADPNNYFDAYVFEFGAVTATLGPIGAEPITFFYGEEPDASFTGFVFESLGPGFRADIGTPDFLAFLQPTLQIAYGFYADGGDDVGDTLELPPNDEEELALDGDPAVPVGNPFVDAYYRGIRGTLTPFAGEGLSATGGFSFAQLAGNAGENADALDDNVDVTVYGLDGQVSLSIFNLSFEYAQNQIDEGAYFQQGDSVLANEDGDPVDFDGNIIDEGDAIPLVQTVPSTSLVYAELTVDTEAAGIPLLDSLEANYRDIPELWYGLKYDEDDYPYELDQTGFGAEATVGLSIFNLTGFIDSYTVDTEVGEPTEEAIALDGSTVVGSDVMAYGVQLGVEVYRAVEIFGFYTVATLDGTAVEDLGDAERNEDYVPGLGVGVEHDGEAEDALVPGLNFSVAYDFLSGNFTAASVDTEFVLGAFTLTPYVDYSVDESAELLSDDVTALEAGTGLATEPLDVFLQPSFSAVVNYRNAVHTDVEGVAGGYTANVLQYAFGVTFNEFLFANSVLGARYGSYFGDNVEIENNLNGEDDNASDISDGDEPGTGTQTTTGYEVVWNYYGLEFAYGAYVNTRPAGSTGGQAFSISYTVNF